MNGVRPSNFSLRITAFPRVHVTLIGMNSEGYRINGGFGFSISNPEIHFSFKSSKKFKFIDERRAGFNLNEIERIKNIIENAKVENDLDSNIECIISGLALTHYGLGTSTIAHLACIEALFIINNHPYNESLITYYSKRGGTSGVGVNTYFKGGYVFDVGIPNKKTSDLQPSSISTNRPSLPLVLSSGKLPNWSIGILIPNRIPNLSEEEEIIFFKKTCPINNDDVNAILYEVVYGSLASLLEGSQKGFIKSINKIQDTKWKKEERNIYQGRIELIEKKLKENGADAVGMSSLGPGMFFLYNSLELQKISSDEFDSKIFLTNFNNSPRIIKNG